MQVLPDLVIEAVETMTMTKYYEGKPRKIVAVMDFAMDMRDRLAVIQYMAQSLDNQGSPLDVMRIQVET